MVAVLVDAEAPRPVGARAGAAPRSGRRGAARPAHDLRPSRGAPTPRIAEHRPLRVQVSPAVLRRRRIVALGLLVTGVLTAVIALQAALGHAGGGPLTTTGGPGGAQSAASQVWVVRPGDTLWGIAKAIQPHGDVRPLVDRLAAEVGDHPLQAGERIPLP